MHGAMTGQTTEFKKQNEDIFSLPPRQGFFIYFFPRHDTTTKVKIGTVYHILLHFVKMLYNFPTSNYF